MSASSARTSAEASASDIGAAPFWVLPDVGLGASLPGAPAAAPSCFNDCGSAACGQSAAGGKASSARKRCPGAGELEIRPRGDARERRPRSAAQAVSRASAPPRAAARGAQRPAVRTAYLWRRRALCRSSMRWHVRLSPVNSPSGWKRQHLGRPRGRRSSPLLGGGAQRAASALLAEPACYAVDVQTLRALVRIAKAARRRAGGGEGAGARRATCRWRLSRRRVRNGCCAHRCRSPPMPRSGGCRSTALQAHTCSDGRVQVEHARQCVDFRRDHS